MARWKRTAPFVGLLLGGGAFCSTWTGESTVADRGRNELRAAAAALVALAGTLKESCLSREGFVLLRAERERRKERRRYTAANSAATVFSSSVSQAVTSKESLLLLLLLLLLSLGRPSPGSLLLEMRR